MPDRVQRSRKKGSKLPPGTVCVTRPGPFGNPFSPHGNESLADVVEAFRKYAVARLAAESNWLAPLVGKDLACWCPLDHPCHANVLLHLANGQEDWGTPITNRKCESCGRREGCTRGRDGREDGVPLGELEKCSDCGRMACPDCHHEGDCCTLEVDE